jgi:hypothetical protein
MSGIFSSLILSGRRHPARLPFGALRAALPDPVAGPMKTAGRRKCQTPTAEPVLNP